MPLYTLFYDFFHYFRLEIISRILAFLLMIFQAFYLVKLNLKHSIIEERTYLPAIFFIILSSSFIPIQRLHPIFLSNIFLLFTLDCIFSSQKKESAITDYFNASLLISIGSLFYLNLFFYIFLVWGSLLIIRPFRWREWVITLIGLLLPYILTECFYYLFQNDLKGFGYTIALNLLFDNFPKFFNFSYIYSNLCYYIFYGFITLLIIFASRFLLIDYKYRKVTSRNCLIVNLWLFVITTVIFYLIPSASLELLLVYAIPVSFIISNYLISSKKIWISDIIMLIIFGLLIYIQVIN
jgi:hypothetical protein